MIIGLTGGSGTGKSTASRFFGERNFLIIDCDRLAREVCSPGEECLEEIKQTFGNGVIDTDGTLKRRVLAEIVFSDKDKLSLLNSITHKHIVFRIHNILEETRCKNAVIDAPLLFEAGLDSICDITLAVLSLPENRIERICKRDGISEKEANARISSQQDDSYYRERCTYIMENNGDVESLFEKLNEVFGGIDGKE